MAKPGLPQYLTWSLVPRHCVQRMEDKSTLAKYLAAGVVIGIGLGLALDNFSVGIGLGVAIGFAFFGKRRRDA